MPLLTDNSTTLDRNLATLKGHVADSALALNYFASKAAKGFQWLWALPRPELLELLNADLPWTLQLFNANTATGQAVNAQLDGIGLARLSNRVPVEIEREDIIFDQETMQFVAYDPPPPPEPEVVDPEPEPEPEPDPAPPDPEPLPEP